jgi:hypothetical protein
MDYTVSIDDANGFTVAEDVKVCAIDVRSRHKKEEQCKERGCLPHP